MVSQSGKVITSARVQMLRVMDANVSNDVRESQSTKMLNSINEWTPGSGSLKQGISQGNNKSRRYYGTVHVDADGFLVCNVKTEIGAALYCTFAPSRC